ncbi:hypothetical protein [Vulcanisaeta thermophila]|uniref:hypothetical protein n=1 Tax=Vulcanisaeta thermophila TaxID=867917 RepID=UPI000852B77F|nr:hypothetical protein [Vulcanisaeta thermophila]
MQPEAVPIIKSPEDASNLLFTGKVAIEVGEPADVELISARARYLGKEVMAIGQVGIARFLHEVPGVRWVIIVNSMDGSTWLRYLTNLVNVIPGITLDLLMRYIDLKPQLLNIPSELFLDPVIAMGGAHMVPLEVPDRVVRWISEFIDSGGDLYLRLRGNIKDLNLISRSRLLIVDNKDLAELYNRMIKVRPPELIIRSGCDFCGANDALCILTCPEVELIRELSITH